MQHSTIDQLGTEEILCKKGQELGINHLQRMVPPVHEATEGTCNIEIKNKVGQ